MPGDASYRVLDHAAIHRLEDSERQLALDVLVGLSAERRRLPSKYFYDDLGSRYFRQIMKLEEYYLTPCELEILDRKGADLASRLTGQPFHLVDLGAGDGAKTVVLLKHLVSANADLVYVPIDISEGAMRGLADTIAARLPQVRMRGLVSDYAEGLRWLGAQASERTNVVLFLGSNIGNFNRSEARTFLRGLWNELRSGDAVLIGFDLKKDIEVMLGAYNDPEGVTAAFNLNLLARINNELGADFDLGKWRHYGTYNVLSGAMESFLVSLERQLVRIEALEHEFAFEAWEPIQTEFSYKYLPSDISALARETGFSLERDYADSRRYFVDSLWRVRKPARRARGGDKLR
jgi:dimethylhistidine N-methyltransferase